MARLLGEEAPEIVIGNGFKFSGVTTDKLGASEYTLVGIGVDETGSTSGFKDELLACLKATINSCKKSPRADNILVRVYKFSSSLPHNGIVELHGYKPLSDIDVDSDYPAFNPGGMTNLIDAAYSAIASCNAYAEVLSKDDFMANGINFIITDGEDNDSTLTMGAVEKEIKKGITSEAIESCINICIGVNASSCSTALNKFVSNSGFDKFIDAGDANEKQLAKLAHFVSQSVSSQSTSLGTGGPSQSISATI